MIRTMFTALLLVPLTTFAPLSVSAQGLETAFGNPNQDTDAPIEVVADRLEVSDSTNNAIFVGNVEIIQDALTMTAPRVEVTYLTDDPATDAVEDGVSRVLATGGVTLVSGDDAAQGQTADYSVDTDVVVLTGDVILTQGRNVISGQEAQINLADNTALMTGRVRTIINPGQN